MWAVSETMEPALVRDLTTKFDRWFGARTDGDGFYRPNPSYRKFDEHGCYRDLPTQANYGPADARQVRHLHAPCRFAALGIFTKVDG